MEYNSESNYIYQESNVNITSSPNEFFDNIDYCNDENEKYTAHFWEQDDEQEYPDEDLYDDD